MGTGKGVNIYWGHWKPENVLGHRAGRCPDELLAALKCRMIRPKEFKEAQEALEKRRASSKRGSDPKPVTTIFGPNQVWSGAAALNLKKTAKIWPAISCSIERSYRILTARSTLTAKSTWFWRRYRPGLTQKTSLVPTMPSYFGVCPDKVNPCCLTYTSMNVQHLDCLRYFHENGSTSGKEITLRGTWDVASLLLCQTESLKRQSQKGDTRPSAEISRPADTTVVPPRPTTCQKTLSSTGIQTDPIQGVIQRDACSGTVSQSSRPDVRTSKDLADYLAEMRLS